MPATAEKSSDRAIVATRVFDAPRDLVWKMWTDPEHIAHWWGPDGFRNTIHEMDVRPGGVFRFVMHGPDGTDYQNKFVYVEVDEPKKLVYDHVTGPLFRATATFDEQGGKTAVNVEMEFASAELRDKVAEEFGAVEGLQQTLQHLADRLAAAKTFVFSREFDAPQEMVFKAWTEPQQLARWWGPKYFINTRCEIDLRRGGAIAIDQKHPDGTVFPMRGMFHEIDAPNRLVFTMQAMIDANGTPALEAFGVVTFEARGEKTLLTMHATITKSPEIDGVLDAMQEGWTESLEKLADDFTTGGQFTISRLFDAPRELVWDVWTKCEHLAKWWGPKGMSVAKCELDFRPGGTFHYGLRTPDGSIMWGKWTFREIEKPKRFVVLAGFSDEAGGITRHPMAPDWPALMLSTMEFEAHGEQTIVTVHWAPYDATEVEKAIFEKSHASMQGGWGGTFDQLDAYLGDAK